MTEVRTRFAPSPTGILHIGGFRSALYNWLFARHHGGKFLLRIEDTDRTRLVPGAIRSILQCFEWFGLDIDEGPSTEELKAIDELPASGQGIGGPYGPYMQSNRLAGYQDAAAKLIASGHAYRCDCTSEMLERERLEQQARKEVPGYSGYCRTREVGAEKPHVVRFKMPHKPSIVVEDLVKGRLEWESVPLKDPVLLKSAGFPTYHLAVVVDDVAMKISHVMRADEWAPSLPLHALIYDALGYERPQFAHLPPVLGPDGKKLSKRHGSTSWDSFKEAGYLPEALLNFVTLIGWAPGEGTDQEIFTKEELVKAFTVERVNAAGGVFDYTKLSWMNGLYLRQVPRQRFTDLVTPFMREAGIELSPDRWNVIADAVKERAKTFAEIPPMVKFLAPGTLKRDMSAMFGKDATPEKVTEVLRAAKEKISALGEFSQQSIHETLEALPKDLGLKTGAVLAPLRIAVTGERATPPLAESMLALGKGETLKRLDEAVAEVASFRSAPKP